MLGAMAAAGVVDTLFPGPLAVTTTLSGNTNKAQGVFIEMFLTAQLEVMVLLVTKDLPLPRAAAAGASAERRGVGPRRSIIRKLVF